LRQQVVDAVLVDRVRVAAAHLHHLVAATRLDRRDDLRREHAPELRVAKLVDEPHPILASATPACTSSSSPACTGATRSTITSTSPSQTAMPSSPTASTCIDMPSSLQVTQ